MSPRQRSSPQLCIDSSRDSSRHPVIPSLAHLALTDQDWPHTQRVIMATLRALQAYGEQRSSSFDRLCLMVGDSITAEEDGAASLRIIWGEMWKGCHLQVDRFSSPRLLAPLLPPGGILMSFALKLSMVGEPPIYLHVQNALIAL
jgi:hypothetical protein